jgi:RNase P subunit RPR2
MANEQDCAPDLVVRAEEWPHGLRCGECCRLLHDGDPYRERLTGMMGEFPAYMTVCRPCGEGRYTASTAG